MDDEWSALEADLQGLRAAGRTLRVWWRDDDAANWSEALAALLARAERFALPLALAVVPARLDPTLPAQLRQAGAEIAVLQHGYRHRNEAVPGERAVECGGARDTAAILADLREGRHRLSAAFGPRFLPVMVPPWNRIEDRVAAVLPEAGYRGLSAFGDEGVGPANGFTRADAHLDILRWRGGARFAGEAKLLEEMRAWLSRQPADRAATFGLLTHHLDHDAAAWAFLDRLLPLLVRLAQPVSAAAVFRMEAARG